MQDTEDEINLLDLLQVVADNLRLLVLGPLAVGLVALGISFTIAPSFTASTKFMPPQQGGGGMAAMMMQSLGALGGLASAATGLKNPNDQFVSLLKSRSLRDALIDRFKLMERYDAELRLHAHVALEGATLIKSGKDNLIEIEVSDREPAFAAELANAYVEEFQKLLGRLALTEAQHRRQFFETQLEQTKDKMTQAEQALKATGINSSAFKTSPEAAIGMVAQLEAQIAVQEVKLGSMRGYLSESAPDFKQALTELGALRAQKAKFERSDSKPIKPDEADYVARYRDYKYFETMFTLFSKQFELAKVDEAREGTAIQVVDVALPPERKSKPKRALIAILTTLTTGMVLLLFVFARQAWRNARQTPETAAKLEQLQAALRRAMPKRAR